MGKTLEYSFRTLGSSLAGKLTRDAANGLLYSWSRELLDYSETTPKVTGLDELPTGSPYIFMSNHRSLYDIPTLVVGLQPHPIRLVAKSDLFKVPLWGQAMLAAEIIKVDRSDREQAIRDLEVAGEMLHGGLCVWIAPEGGRSRDGKLRAFKKGGFMMALKTGVPIVPVGIAGTEGIAPVDKLVCYKGASTAMAVGEPIDVQAILDKKGGDVTEARDRLIARVREDMCLLVARAEALRS
jgi:1-acyl-sn-glycerol-3-phosphate acyltransferase